jgi:ribosomal-protein-alanine N-acetyltransferase
MSATHALPAWTTARMTVRPLAPEDEALYCHVYTDARLMRHCGPALAGDHAKRSFGAAVAASQRQPLRHVYFALQRTQTGEPLGVSALRDIDPVEKSAEIGLILCREAHASGFAREALSGVAAWGFTQLPVDRIYGRADSSNLAATRMARQTGFLLVESDAGGTTASGNLFVINRPVPGATTANEKEKPC